MKGVAGLALGFILVGTANHEAATEMLHFLMEKTATELQEPNMRFVALGIGLIFLGNYLILHAQLVNILAFWLEVIMQIFYHNKKGLHNIKGLIRQ